MKSDTGQTIAGRYRLEAVLGRGAAGVVYRATDLELSELIAVKLVHGRRDAQEIERFKREIVTARRISHGNVLRIHDFGIGEDVAYISMELLNGGTLTDRMERGLVPIGEAIEIGIGICEGLHAAHGQSVIHRDVKPDNVLFDDAGRPKIVDFGLARLTNSQNRTVGFSGTPFYMSPEQANGLDVTPSSDLYSLGVTLYELFTGRRPFEADSLVRLAIMHSAEPPPEPRSWRPELPRELEAFLLRALQKEPARRFASAQEMSRQLAAARDAQSITEYPRGKYVESAAAAIPSGPGHEVTVFPGEEGGSVPEYPLSTATDLSSLQDAAEEVTAIRPRELPPDATVEGVRLPRVVERPAAARITPAVPATPSKKKPPSRAVAAAAAAAAVLALLFLVALVVSWLERGSRGVAPVAASSPTPAPTPAPTTLTVQRKQTPFPTPTSAPAPTSVRVATPGRLFVKGGNLLVRVDGKEVADDGTGTLKNHPIAPGPHRITAELRGTKIVVERDVVVRAGKRTRLVVDRSVTPPILRVEE